METYENFCKDAKMCLRNTEFQKLFLFYKNLREGKKLTTTLTVFSGTGYGKTFLREKYFDAYLDYKVPCFSPDFFRSLSSKGIILEQLNHFEYKNSIRNLSGILISGISDRTKHDDVLFRKSLKNFYCDPKQADRAIEKYMYNHKNTIRENLTVTKMGHEEPEVFCPPYFPVVLLTNEYENIKNLLPSNHSVIMFDKLFSVPEE